MRPGGGEASLSDGGASADIVADLAGQELTVARRGEELATFHGDLAAQDRYARPAVTSWPSHGV
jgi:hypothetical protein